LSQRWCADDTASPAESEESRGEASPDASAEAAAESAAEPEAAQAAEVQPTTLAKAQSAAAEREQGEEVGDTGAALLSLAWHRPGIHTFSGYY
jgi:hypothetical protein